MTAFEFEVSKDDLAVSKPVDSGAWYRCVFTSFKETPIKAGGTHAGKPFLSIYLKVSDENSPFNGALCSDGFTMPEPIARQRLVGFVKALGEDVQAGSKLNMEFLKGKECEVWIEVEEYNGEARNKAKRYRPIQ